MENEKIILLADLIDKDNPKTIISYVRRMLSNHYHGKYFKDIESEALNNLPRLQ